MAPFDHAVFEIERSAVDGERTVTSVMHHSTLFAALVDPDPRRLKDEEVVRVRELGIDDPAFDVSQAVTEERSRHVLGRLRPEGVPLEFIHPIPRTVPDVDNGFGEIETGYSDDTFPGFPESPIAVIPGADDATDEWRVVLDHHMKAHRHHVGLVVIASGDHDDRAWLQYAISLRWG
jgi:hypothetical protein